jgi:hypothetical protein
MKARCSYYVFKHVSAYSEPWTDLVSTLRERGGYQMPIVA